MHLVEPGINPVTTNRLLFPNFKCVLLARLRQLLVVDVLYVSVAEAHFLVEDGLQHLNFLAELLRLDKGHTLEVVASYSLQVLLRMLQGLLLLFVVLGYRICWLDQIVESSYHVMYLSLLENAVNDNFIYIRTAIFEEFEEKVLWAIQPLQIFP